MVPGSKLGLSFRGGEEANQRAVADRALGRGEHRVRVVEIAIENSDSFVLVFTEYNGAAKKVIDFLHHDGADKAVGMISYGGNVGAGTRAVQALKSVILAVRALLILESVSIPFVDTMFDAEGRFPASPGLSGRRH